MEMDTRDFIESLVPEVAHNASVVRVDDRGDTVRVTIAGTTGVEAGCEVPRETVEGAAAARRGAEGEAWEPESAEAYQALVAALKACADRAVAPVPDGRA